MHLMTGPRWKAATLVATFVLASIATNGSTQQLHGDK
jgi:hypothetical protein